MCISIQTIGWNEKKMGGGGERKKEGTLRAGQWSIKKGRDILVPAAEHLVPA